MEMMIDKKQIQAVFLFEFKRGCKAAGTTRNISNAFGIGTANKHTEKWWLEKFCKGDESLEDEGWSGQPSGSWQWPIERVTEADPLYSYMRGCQRTQCWPSKQTERWKSMISGCLMSWPQIKKFILLKCCLLSFYITTMNHFLIGLWCGTKSGFYMTASSDQLGIWTEKTLQSSSQSQTGTRESHGHCLVVCCPSDPLQLFESWRSHYTS